MKTARSAHRGFVVRGTRAIASRGTLKKAPVVAMIATGLAGSFLSAPRKAHGASATWVANPTDANWSTSNATGNWQLANGAIGVAFNGANAAASLPGLITTGANPYRFNFDTATFNTPLAVNPAGGTFGGSDNPIAIDLNRQLGSLLFDTNAGAYVIGSTTGNPLILFANTTALPLLNALIRQR